MSERDQYPPGVPCWVDTLQPDPEAAKRFYAELFGWEFAGPGPMPSDPPGRYFVAGRVVAPPYDTPGFRSAVLADPQGAVFSVSKLIPAP